MQILIDWSYSYKRVIIVYISKRFTYKKKINDLHTYVLTAVIWIDERIIQYQTMWKNEISIYISLV